MDAARHADYFRDRAQREIALAKATGAAKAYASVDNRIVYVERRDGTREVVRLKPPEMH